MSRHLTLNIDWIAVPFSALRRIGQWYQQLSKGRLKLRFFKSFIPLFFVGVSLSVVLAANGASSSNVSSASHFGKSPSLIAQQNNIELNLVSFSVTKAAHDKIIPKFVEKWKKERNQNVTFKQSYGASSAQALGVVEGGLEADVVHLSLAPDIQKIERAGLIQPGWEKEFSNNSIVSKSVAAILTRQGNPKGIKTWTDLTKNGVSVITPNP